MSETSEQWTERIVSCLPVKPYYAEDGIIIIKSDCREILPYLPKVDLVLTDPPYGIVEHSGTSNSREKHTYGSFDDTPEYQDSLVMPVLQECIDRFGRVVLTPGNNNLHRYPKARDHGAFFHSASATWMAWGLLTTTVILYYGSDPRAGKGQSPNGLYLAEAAPKNGHPCPKPIKAWTWLADKASLPGETILDPFMGSGTTLVAAKQLGRKAIGIEIEEAYCKIAVQRLAQKVMRFD